MSRNASAPATQASSRTRPGSVLLVACLGAFLAFLDATIVNVAFPSMRDAFKDSSIGSLSWVLNGYNIVFAAFLIVFGRLTDLIGRRRAFVGGVVVFTIASGLCGTATTVEALVAFRVVQALGAALLVPASLALVVAAFPRSRRAHAIGLWGASAAVAAGLGPPIGGLVVDAGGWEWAFLINIPFGLVAIIASRRVLVESRAPGRRVLPDLVGAGLLAIAMGALNLGVVKGADWGWTSIRVIACVLAAGVLTALFVVSSRRHREPLLDPVLLGQRAFAVSSLATVAAGFGFFAYLLTNILWLQYVWQYSVIEAGLALVPGALVAAVVAAALGPLAEKHGHREFIVLGALVWAGSYVWYHQAVGLTPAFWTEWMPGQVLSGLGVGATLPLLGSAGLAAVPGGRFATASAIASSARQLGGVFGIAVLVVVLGDPTAETAVAAFRRGWVLSIIAFVVVAAIALALGRTEEIDPESAQELSLADSGARIHDPAPPESWAPGPAIHSTLAGLPAATSAHLLACMRPVRVAAGTYLLHQGDPPGSAYSVASGRLEVEVDGQVVRELVPGDVLGELALLTGEPRSAAVRARRDSTVLELPRASFDDLTLTDPLASRALLSQMAERLRTAGGPAQARSPLRPTVISVVALTRGVPAAAVAERLTTDIATHRSVVAPGRIGPDTLDQLEKDHQRVVLLAGEDDDDTWREFCLRQADTVVLVARSDGVDERLAIFPTPARQPELVLVGPPPPHPGRAAWVAATDAWDLTLAHGDLAVALRPLGERLAGRSLGLVLAGGGARGMAHIGVLRELEDAGLHVDRVAGTSVGAVIAAAHACGLDGAELEDIAYGEFVRHNLFGDWQLPAHSLLRGRRIHAGLTRTYGADAVIEGLPRQLWMASVDLLSRSRQVHRRGAVVEATLASSRIPGLFPPIPTDDGRLLIDGGVLDNLPVDLLTRRDEGPVVAVNIGAGGAPRNRSGRPRVPALGDTLMRSLMIGSGGAVERARAHGAWVISVAGHGVGLLEFHQMDVLIESGRAAARALLAECDGDLGDLGQPVDPTPAPDAPDAPDALVGLVGLDRAPPVGAVPGGAP
ncbi:MFS transporter [Janibacter sp. Soil728]|uniref:MFS transporter n=1 Tax=Janibacter sp. Soil728 TaxID=1736393 RepID=UPI0009E86FCD|nr:DHA2 family efflux MFS transporter permease subunit [Janibacter sp. Soil728]